ncbi:hypothetical protein ABTP36_19925, partial [Acinetobacter baumannii]
ANAVMEASLKQHIQFLTSDSLEGRRAGSHGEKLAAQYIIAQYQQEGIEPKGPDGYLQKFDIDEGKQATNNSVLIANG